jgi:CheY-like chemotaxis protein
VRAVEVASPLIEQRRHHFEVEVPPHPIHVDGDEARLGQVFINLITNAAKYTPPGGHIELAVGVEGRNVILEVRDDGIGIGRELLSRIFEPFVQGETQSPERSLGGLGIGLSLVRSLVELHGGEVSVRSDGAGQGATFRVRLPMIAAAPVQSEPSESHLVALPSAAGGRRVLVVDDNEDALELLAEILRSVGHQVRTAADGAEALLAANDFHPEVAVLDIGLPVMDGYELAVRLRQALGDAAPLLIALTGYGLKADRLRSSEAGFQRHLVKPIDACELLEAIGAATAQFDGASAGR